MLLIMPKARLKNLSFTKMRLLLFFQASMKVLVFPFWKQRVLVYLLLPVTIQALRKLEKILPCSQIRFDRSSLQTRCCDSNKMKRFGEIWEIRDIGWRRILSGWRLPAKPFNFLRRLLHED